MVRKLGAAQIVFSVMGLIFYFLSFTTNGHISGRRSSCAGFMLALAMLAGGLALLQENKGRR